jgi:hypothetical protein
MLTVGDKKNNNKDFNLNVYGLMSGQCNSFEVEQSAEITELKIAYTSTAVTAIQVGTDTNRYQFFGAVG